VVVDLAPPPADAAPAPTPPVPDVQQPPDRIFGGVAALLAARLDIDALWVRIAFVLLTLVGGFGIYVYGALWLALVVGADPDRRWARLAGGAVLVVGLPLVLSEGFDFFDGPVAVFALLLGLAVALWQPRRPMRAAAPSFERRPEPAVGAEAGDAPATGRRLRRLPTFTPRPPSILGRLTLGIAVVVGAVGALIDQANGGRLHPEQWLGAAAVVCGVGLVTGAVVGRALWLVVPAALLAGTGFVAGEAARIGVRPSAIVGDEYVHVDEGSAGDRREHVVIGTVHVSIDDAPAGPLTVDARVGVGEVRVLAADDVTVEIRAVTDHGRVELRGQARADGTFTIGPEGPPDVVVLARVGRGNVDVDDWTRAPFEGVQPPFETGAQRYLADGVMLTPGGQFVLAEGEAVLGGDGTVLTGSAEVRDRVTVIATSYGEFQVLPGGLLLTPMGELVDLHAVSGELAAPVTTQPAPPATTGDRPPAEVAPTVPVTPPGPVTVTTIPEG
jgi:phage shock protein PspC (stress-responsive transcriptional regulator)